VGRDEEPVPVFVPPLATVLAFAERAKGGPLTPAEVEEARDRASCIMMTPADAGKLRESRGYRDVDPEDCWADWHRLRPQVAGGYLPKIILCVPFGGGRAKAEPLLSGIEHEWRPHEPAVVRSFEAAARYDPAFGRGDLDAVGKHAEVLYVVGPNFPAAKADGEARAKLGLGGKLLEAGGLAIKCESSGVAHSKSRWLDLSRDGSWAARFQAFVKPLITDDRDVWSCGLHLLGLPDLIVEKSALSAEEILRYFHVFSVYLLEECAGGGFRSGHTFRPDAQSPRFRVRWEACSGYDEDDFFFNPFGRRRFVPA
jgi:hypothetical protein